MSYQTMGDVYGYEDVDGDDDATDGEEYVTVGRARKRRKRKPGTMIQIPPRPQWRRQIAPGVPMPGQGLQPLPLRPNLNAGVFTSAVPAIQFTARPQAPFHPERLLASVRRTGALAAGTIIEGQNIFVGRDLQLVELGPFDVEFFSPTAFGVRLQLDAAQPGVLISIDCSTLGPALGVGDSLAVSLMFLGRSIR